MSDGPSIRDHRITMTYFRTCSTRQSRSQAPLCHYTLRLVSNQAEGTFARLRYAFGGDRPSQTAHQTLFPAQTPFGWARVRIPGSLGWYFNVGSPKTGVLSSKPPTYPTQTNPKVSVKLQ